MGWLPSVYLEVVQRRPPAGQRQLTEKEEEGRVNTMSSIGGGSGSGESRSNSLRKDGLGEQVPVPVPIIGKKADGERGNEMVEGFQRGGYYS